MPSSFKAKHKSNDRIQSCSRKFDPIIDEAGITGSGNESLAHDDVRLEELHGDEGESLVVVKHRRDQTGRQLGLMHERQMFIMRARKRQRPALADKAHIGQRLFDGNSAVRPFHDEHEVEVAVAHLADRPIRWRSSELGGNGGQSCKVVSQVRVPQNSVLVLRRSAQWCLR